MCGICGELRFDGAPPDLGAVATMVEHLRRRGPGHGRSYGDGPLGMGHRCLAIIDLSPRSDQPPWSILSSGCPWCSTAPSITITRSAGSSGAWLSILFRRRRRDYPQGLACLGGGLRPAAARHVRLRRLGSVTPGALLARDRTMAWGLETRVPFLDQRLVELAARCPPRLKLREGGKYPLKAMARGLLPDVVIDRPKGYFPMPALKHVRGGVVLKSIGWDTRPRQAFLPCHPIDCSTTRSDFLALMRDLVTSRACRERGLYRREYLDRLLAAPDLHHTRIQGNKLWHLALVELWLQRHVDTTG